MYYMFTNTLMIIPSYKIIMIQLMIQIYNYFYMRTIACLSILLITVIADYTADGWWYTSPPSSPDSFVPFPKIIWTAWNSGLDNAKIFTKLCVNNMNHYAKLSGFQLKFLTDQNYTNYLSAQSNKRMKKILDPKNDINPVGKSDVMRAFLMYQNGGIWTDIHSYFLQNFEWVQNLYKLPGVYNRFFPNPNVLFFTKNRDYSGNKTKVFDQKTQQQVYLFPGMENWFIIAKPKSQYYTDLIAALERYFQVGRDKILQESKKLGIKYGGELNGYFDKANFQLQYVLQKKQKELDALKNPPTKYAVQYYKMWFMNAEYTGFIFLGNVNSNQEINFQLQYSEEMLGSLYGFKVQPHFIKNIGWIATAIDRVLQKNAYNQNCLTVSNTLQPTSLIYKHLINITSMFKQIDDLKQTFSFFQGKCNHMAEDISKIKNITQTIRTILLGTILSIPIINLILFIWNKLKKRNYQRIEMQE